MKQFIVVIEKGADREAFMSFMDSQGIPYEEVRGLKRHFYVDDGFAHEDILHFDDGHKTIKSQGTLDKDFATDNWGKYRTIRRNLPWFLPRFEADKTLEFSPIRTGNGVDIYVVDGRIRDTHEQLTGRVTVILDTVGGEIYNHGTRVASIAAGATIGMAPEALIWNAINFNAAGSALVADTIACLGECLDHYTGRVGTDRPAVVATSIASSSSTVGDAAIDCIEAGMVVVGAAGNDKVDLAVTPVYPAVSTGVVCVGGINANDGPYMTGVNGTNYGTRVDILAPGQSVYVADTTNDTAYTNASGTSYASPHVSGVIAMMLEGHTRLADETEVAAVVAKLVANATTGKFVPGPHDGNAGLPDRILYVDPTLSFETF